MRYHPGIDDDAEAHPGAPAEVMEAKYAQIENLLNRHPKARITFPHMYYLSQDLDRLSSFFGPASIGQCRLDAGF